MPSPATFRRLFWATVSAWIGVNVLLSALGVLFALGDSPVTGTTRVTVAEALWGSGTIVTPPLFFMVVAGLVLWAALSRHSGSPGSPRSS